eukprot:jgi/Astpho2/9390/fgenesh1_pg.00145_%23_15_t
MTCLADVWHVHLRRKPAGALMCLGWGFAIGDSLAQVSCFPEAGSKLRAEGLQEGQAPLQTLLGTSASVASSTTTDAGRRPCRQCSDNSNQPWPGLGPSRVSGANSDLEWQEQPGQAGVVVDTTFLLNGPGITSIMSYNILHLQGAWVSGKAAGEAACMGLSGDPSDRPALLETAFSSRLLFLLRNKNLKTNVADNWKEQLHRLQSDLAQAQGQLQQQRLLTAQLQAQADVAGASLAEAEGQLRAAQADAAAQTARFRESELAHSAEMLRLQVSLQQWQEQHQKEARQCDAAAALQQRCADLEERCQWQEQQQGGLVQIVQQLEADQSAAQAREQGQQAVIAGLQEQAVLAVKAHQQELRSHHEAQAELTARLEVAVSKQAQAEQLQAAAEQQLQHSQDELHTQAAAACRREAALEAQLQQLMQELQHERVEHAAALHASGEECRAAQGETARVKADLRQVERRHQAQAGQLEEAEAAWHTLLMSEGALKAQLKAQEAKALAALHQHNAQGKLLMEQVQELVVQKAQHDQKLIEQEERHKSVLQAQAQQHSAEVARLKQQASQLQAASQDLGRPRAAPTRPTRSQSALGFADVAGSSTEWGSLHKQLAQADSLQAALHQDAATVQALGLLVRSRTVRFELGGLRPGSAGSPAQVLRLQRQVRELQERLNVTQLQQQTTI